MNLDILSQKRSIKAIFNRALKHFPIIKLAVVCPENSESLHAVLKAADENIVYPILLGSAEKMKKLAAKIECRLSNYEYQDATQEEAIRLAIEFARTHKVQAIMKGSLQTHDLMSAIVHRDSGLRTGRRISMNTLMDIPSYKKPLIIGDVGLNIAPDLNAKKDILLNAIDFAHALGIATPKVALLSAVETVLEQMPSTGEFYELAQMAARGEIKGAVVEGPMGFDIAISKRAALTKKVSSQVSGEPDVLIVPNIEAGNILFKALRYLASGKTFSIALGAKIPIIITSRSDSFESKLGSCILTRLFQ